MTRAVGTAAAWPVDASVNTASSSSCVAACEPEGRVVMYEGTMVEGASATCTLGGTVELAVWDCSAVAC